jgi:hypothetical protein
VVTLREFVGIERHPDTNTPLDDVCPDVVALIDGKIVGIELTAYSDNEAYNRWSAVMRQVWEVARADSANKYSDLCGFDIQYSPKKKNVLRKRDIPHFVGQLFGFVHAKHTEEPFTCDEDRVFSKQHTRAPRRIFQQWDLLEQHVDSVKVHYRVSNQDTPVSVVPDGFASLFGTSIEHLVGTFEKKEHCLRNAYMQGLAEVWLLIHATGSPRSSRISPLSRPEIDDLLASTLCERARKTGFDHVFLWDGLRGGLVDFVAGESLSASLA